MRGWVVSAALILFIPRQEMWYPLYRKFSGPWSWYRNINLQWSSNP